MKKGKDRKGVIKRLQKRISLKGELYVALELFWLSLAKEEKAEMNSGEFSTKMVLLIEEKTNRYGFDIETRRGDCTPLLKNR